LWWKAMTRVRRGRSMWCSARSWYQNDSQPPSGRLHMMRSVVVMTEAGRVIRHSGCACWASWRFRRRSAIAWTAIVPSISVGL